MLPQVVWLLLSQGFRNRQQEQTGETLFLLTCSSVGCSSTVVQAAAARVSVVCRVPSALPTAALRCVLHENQPSDH